MSIMSEVKTPPQAAVAGWERGLWCLAAVVLAAEQADPSLARAAADVLGATAVDTVGAPAPEVTQNVAALKASLLQAAGLVGAERFDWLQQSDEALLAQGRAGTVGAAAMVSQLLPALGDLTARLAAPGAQLLDVGTGVGALAVAFAEQLPSVTVTGIDVSDRVLELARTTRTASQVADRVQLRLQDIAALTERDHYDLVWLPAPFLPPSALHAGVQRAAAALRPGGWIVLGHGKLHGEPLDVALTRLKTIAYGGTALSDSEAQDLLAVAGLDRVATVATPHEAPGVTVGHRPEPTGRTLESSNPPTGSEG